MKFVCLDFSFYAEIYKSKSNIFLARFLRYSTHDDQFFKHFLITFQSVCFSLRRKIILRILDARECKQSDYAIVKKQ